MTVAYDAVIVGGGPAGASAAIRAAALGLTTCLLDEQDDAGGQVYRPTALPGATGSDARAGDRLRAELAASPVSRRFGHRVWAVEPGFRVAALGPDGPVLLHATTLILATGAQERHIPVPGWTRPGVFGLAAATILMKAHGVLPGRRVVVAGTGPLLYAVAGGILEAGGEVVAVLDAQPRGAWLRRLPGIVSRPGLAVRGAAWQARLLARGVPILSGWAVTSVAGDAAVAQVGAAPIAGGAARTFGADALCLGYGLLPATEAARLLGAAHEYDAGLGGWRLVTDQEGRTSVAGLFACGDGADPLGEAVAPLRGQLAALAAAADLGRIGPADFARQARPLRTRLRRRAGFGRIMAELSRPPPDLVAWMPADTVVCRCEGLTRATLDAAISGGHTTLPGLKAATRCGMGPCGGRICEHAAAGLIAHRTGRDLSHIQPGRPRPPLRPVPIDAICGAFDYDSLPIPAPAPL